MNPTLQKAVDALAVTDEAIDFYRRWLAQAGNFDYRSAAAIGILEYRLSRLAEEATTDDGRRHLIEAIAVMAARDELAEQEIARDNYVREDPVNPNFTLPPGIDGYAVGRQQ